MARKKRTLGLLIALLFVAGAIVLALFAVLWSDEKSTDIANTNTEKSQEVLPKEKPKPPLIDLQQTVDEWLARQPADFGIVVYDYSYKQVIASHQPDKQYFAASLYKLFVAYLALQDFQSGTQNPNEILTAGLTRKECVDKMIRESHSPCGEAMMASMGQENLRARMSEIGIKNTTFAGIATTAQDSALVLRYILEMRDLNTDNTAFLKDAMRVQDQRFRNGLYSGAPEATWETKVGWNEDRNYHDVGIMTMPDGRQFTVAILSQNNGSSTPIADFAATIYAALRRN